MNDKKAQIIEALRRFINQRPGLEYGNYGDAASYRSECRSIARDRREALTLLAAVQWRDSITAEQIIEAAKGAYSGRLAIALRDDGSVAISYCTGQYFPTEYRRAVCAVAASILWARARADHGSSVHVVGSQVISAGDWLRKHFRREFGRGIASRWFR